MGSTRRRRAKHAVRAGFQTRRVKLRAKAVLAASIKVAVGIRRAYLALLANTLQAGSTRANHAHLANINLILGDQAVHTVPSASIAEIRVPRDAKVARVVDI